MQSPLVSSSWPPYDAVEPAQASPRRRALLIINPLRRGKARDLLVLAEDREDRRPHEVVGGSFHVLGHLSF